MLFFFMLIQVASFGADQFNFGATSPPSSAIVSLICWWISGKAKEGSGSRLSSQPSLVELSLYVEGGGKVGVSDGRTMPSSRR